MRADVLLVDGRHLLWRNADKLRQLEATPDGRSIRTGGTYGFIKSLFTVKEAYGGIVIVAWEGTSNWRFDVLPDYKRKRTKPEPDGARVEFISAMKDEEGLLVGLLSSIGVRQYRPFNGEADDVLGRLAKQFSDRGRKVVIYTGDSDLRQCVGEHVSVLAPPAPGGKNRRPKLYGVDEVKAKHGVAPSQIPDLKALAGDSSDNITGVHGIGPKTAVALLEKYGDISAVWSAAQAEVDGDAKSEWPVAYRHAVSIINTGATAIAADKVVATVNVGVALDAIPRRVDLKAARETLGSLRMLSLMTPMQMRKLTALGGA